MEWKNLRAHAASATPARRLLLREPYETRSKERNCNDGFALKALRYSRRNFTCKILAVVEGRPWGAQSEFCQAHFSCKVAYRRARHNMNHLATGKDIAESIPADISAGTRVLIHSAVHAYPNLVCDTNAH